MCYGDPFVLSLWGIAPIFYYLNPKFCRGPDGLLRLVGLSAREINKDAAVLSEIDVNKLRNQTPGKSICHSESPRLGQDITNIPSDHSSSAIINLYKRMLQNPERAL